MCKLLSQLAHLSHCSFIKESDQVTASHRIHDCHNQWSNPISFHTYNPSVFIILFFPISVVIFHTQEVLITVPLLLLSKKCAIFIGWRHTWLVEQVSVKTFNCYIVVLSLQFDWQLPLWNFSPRIFRCSGVYSMSISMSDILVRYVYLLICIDSSSQTADSEYQHFCNLDHDRDETCTHLYTVR